MDNATAPVTAPITAPAPWTDRAGPVRSVVRGVRSLLSGLAITGNYLRRPSTVVTQQYPENRATLQMTERFRGKLTFVHDDKGFHKCTVCRICEEMCPNVSIVITARAKPAVSKKELDTFVWRHDACTYCNTCVMVCPFGVLNFTPGFESAVYDRRLLMYTLNGYAGPTGPVLEKMATPEDQQAAMEPRARFAGPIGLGGWLAAQQAQQSADAPPQAPLPLAELPPNTGGDHAG